MNEYHGRTLLRSLLFPSVMFCMQHRFSHFGELNKCGNNVSFVQCVHLFPEAFISHHIYIGDFSVSLCTGWIRRLTGLARFQLFGMRSSSPSVVPNFILLFFLSHPDSTSRKLKLCGGTCDFFRADTSSGSDSKSLLGLLLLCVRSTHFLFQPIMYIYL